MILLEFVWRYLSVSVILRVFFSTLPDFPAEIRAPAGSLFGVSSFQLQFGSKEIFTPGDDLDVLVAMNPAGLKVHLSDLKGNGTLIINTANFTSRNLKLAGYDESTLDNDSLDNDCLDNMNDFTFRLMDHRVAQTREMID